MSPHVMTGYVGYGNGSHGSGHGCPGHADCAAFLHGHCSTQGALTAPHSGQTQPSFLLIRFLLWQAFQTKYNGFDQLNGLLTLNVPVYMLAGATTASDCVVVYRVP